MRGLGTFGIWIILAAGVWGIPFTPYEAPQFGGATEGVDNVPGTKLMLKRSAEPDGVHPEIARVQAINRAFKKFSKRLLSPVKRDAYAEILSKHYEIVKRGEVPGSGHFIERRDPSSGSKDILFGETPAVSPALALDEDAYFSAIEIGSLKKQFLVVMDTGSSDLWVPAANCRSEACRVHKTLGSNDSTSLQASNQPWKIQYGTGSAGGVIIADKVSVGGLSVSRMPFGAATQLSTNFALFIPDGILGLALTEANAQGVPTVMDQLKSNKLIKHKLIGVNLQRASDGVSDGEISFGVVDTGKFTGSLSIVPNVGVSGLWEVPTNDVVVDGQPLGFTNKTSIIDTGTTLMIIPPDDASTIHAAIPGSITDGQGDFAFPCSTSNELAIRFAGHAFSISPKDYVGRHLNGSNHLCQSNIVGQQVGDANQWLLGDVFLKNVYTVFDYDNNQIGFGEKGTNGTSSKPATNDQTLMTSSDAARSSVAIVKALVYSLGFVNIILLL